MIACFFCGFLVLSEHANRGSRTLLAVKLCRFPVPVLALVAIVNTGTCRGLIAGVAMAQASLVARVLIAQTNLFVKSATIQTCHIAIVQS